ncbi:NAD(P)-dependent oxidoreductase [Agrobacterium sp. LAD9]|uniref:NAD(P)-dependent oxidoreductase n=1 Tax=Agrobacterium sp. LAD9 TaxID=2055153 RepID=UPI000D1E11FA|nr:NAD(P)-dependent oxidoreductase [Agrobacterium sp. LAD9]
MNSILSGRRPVIASHLTELQAERLRQHASQPVVIEYTKTQEPWDVPPEADFLFTFMRGWARAPRDAPPHGWPYNLRWIQVGAAGLDAFPRWFFHDLPISSGRGIQSTGIAEYVLAAILLHEKRLDRTVARSPADWREYPLGGLAGKTVGLLGFGAIGSAVAQRALAFGTRVLVYRRSADAPGIPGVERAATLEQLAAESDHLVIASALTPETRNIVGSRFLSHGKPGQHLINVSRGAHIDQEALVTALDAGILAAATLDVTDPEPLPEGHPIYTHPKIRLTPHTSGQTERFDDLLTAKLFANLDRFLAGRPLIDQVDPERGY